MDYAAAEASVSEESPSRSCLSRTSTGQMPLSLVTDTDTAGSPATWDRGTRSRARGQLPQEELPPLQH